MLLQCLVTVLVSVLFLDVHYAERLGRFIKHYDTLDYSLDDLHLKHERTRRAAPEEDDSVHLDFTAHGRDFKLRLRPGSPYLSPDLIVETTEGAKPHQPDYLYTGHLDGESDSNCHGSILNGLFLGNVYTHDDTYHVEAAHRHFDEPTSFHSIIYKGTDVEHPLDGGCGLTGETMKWMRKVQESAVKDAPPPPRKSTPPKQKDWVHVPNDNPYTTRSQHRSRRQVPERNTCNLYMQSDHTYTAYFNNDQTEVITQFNNFVSAINAIYGRYQFGNYLDVGFIVDRIRINDTDDLGDSNPFRFENIGVEKFLDLNSLQNHDDYCLAYVFANRDFNDGVLGLAWVGSPGSTSGGICETYKLFSSGYQSLNTGIVTVKNYGSQVPVKVTEITFAHEVGHNFGSPHDYPLSCKPGDSPATRGQGNYIMYASATSGDKPNNNELSSCSLSNMTNVINAKADRCFVSSSRAVCGNQIVDEGEECDCGYGDQCEDACCIARDASRLIAQNSGACKKNTDSFGHPVECSKSEGFCCSSTCNFISAATDEECRPATECSDLAKCNGASAKCPPSTSKPDDTHCNNNKQICKGGECNGSLCSLVDGMQECYCTKAPDGQVDTQCHLCCQKGSDEGTCTSTFYMDEFKNLTAQFGEVAQDESNADKVLYQVPGAPCNELLGYCDVFYKCRNVDSSGPLSRLRDAILNPQLYKDIADWLKDYWWAAVLIGLGLIIFMALFIKLCSVHTPSSNPNLPKHRQLTLPRRPSSRQHPSGSIEMA